jgi:hypothetical protein
MQNTITKEYTIFMNILKQGLFSIYLINKEKCVEDLHNKNYFYIALEQINNSILSLNSKIAFAKFHPTDLFISIAKYEEEFVYDIEEGDKKIKELINNKQFNIGKIYDTIDSFLTTKFGTNYLNKNNNSKLDTRNLGRRYYSSYSRHYLNKRIIINKIDLRSISTNVKGKYQYYVIYLAEIEKLLMNSPLNEETQMKIEKYLLNQGNVLLKNKLDDIKDLNYDQLNKEVLEVLYNSKDNLLLLVNNYRINIKKLIKNIIFKQEYYLPSNKNKNYIYYLINEILLDIDNYEIVQCLLGRVLRIISNYNVISSSNMFTAISIDIGKDIVRQSLIEKFKKVNEPNYGFSDFLDTSLSNEDNLVLNYNSVFLRNDSLLFILGSNLINYLLEINLIIMETKVISKTEKQTILKPVQSIIDKVKD